MSNVLKLESTCRNIVDDRQRLSTVNLRVGSCQLRIRRFLSPPFLPPHLLLDATPKTVRFNLLLYCFAWVISSRCFELITEFFPPCYRLLRLGARGYNRTECSKCIVHVHRVHDRMLLLSTKVVAMR